MPISQGDLATTVLALKRPLSAAKQRREESPNQQHAEPYNNENNRDLRWSLEPVPFCRTGLALLDRGAFAEFSKELAVLAEGVLADAHPPLCADVLARTSTTLCT